MPDENQKKPEKLEYTDPSFVMSFIMAGFSDLIICIGLFSVLIPIFGIVVLGITLLFHYFFGIALWAMTGYKLKHILPKLVFGLVVLLPLPLLSAGLALAILLQNKIIEEIVVVAAAAVVTVMTAGAGAPVAAGAVGGAGAGGAAAGGAAAGSAAATAGAGAAAGTEAAGGAVATSAVEGTLAETATTEAGETGIGNIMEENLKALEEAPGKAAEPKPQLEPRQKPPEKGPGEKFKDALDRIRSQDEDEDEEEPGGEDGMNFSPPPIDISTRRATPFMDTSEERSGSGGNVGLGDDGSVHLDKAA